MSAPRRRSSDHNFKDRHAVVASENRGIGDLMTARHADSSIRASRRFDGNRPSVRHNLLHPAQAGSVNQMLRAHGVDAQRAVVDRHLDKGREKSLCSFASPGLQVIRPELQSGDERLPEGGGTVLGMAVVEL